ncbi:uncharacterized protein LOC111603803 [Drosophila hydei]|uniref:Nucleoporin NUP35 n=1 Tax=Drosophila hydei TaxID=7224 RepID=A0A6J1MAE5_DROHY|nr:uncharacterized protein LOC111603803 [Drosophila hydei]
MANAGAFAGDIEGNPAKQYLPPFVAVYAERTEIEVKAKAKKRKLTSMAVIKAKKRLSRSRGELGHESWIAVSGYQLDCASLVYRFFLDIGQIVDRSFTSCSLMYLRYDCMQDCELALSYDGQKVGYGADMLVRVRQEHPLLEMRCESTQLAVVADHEVSQPITCDIDMAAIDKRAASQLPAVAEPQSKRRKFSLLQWLKHQISYLFYLNEAD